MSSELVEIKILVPRRIYEEIEKVARKRNISVEDLVTRTLIFIIEQMK